MCCIRFFLSVIENIMNVDEELLTIEKNFIRQAQKAHAPIHGSIELLPLCNMNCNMCYVRLSKEDMEKK